MVDASMIEFFSEWRAAAKAACAAERIVSEAYMRYFNDSGEEPTPDQIEAAKQKRAIAARLFWDAMKNARST